MSSIGQLFSLSLDGQGHELARWQKNTNFDMIHTLKVGNTDAGVLEWAADNAKFPSLSTLELQTGPGETGPISATLLQSLPSLTDLTILSHVNDATLDAISNHYGTTLQRLSLPNFLCSVDDLRNLKQGCQLLEHLSIMIARTEVTGTSASCTRHWGDFPKLQSLHLTLDCSVNVGTECVCDQPSFDPGTRDTNYKNDFVRRTLVNCAVDGTLAAAIFRRIATATEIPHSPLQSVELVVVRAGIIVSRGQEHHRQQRNEFYRHFTRRWICSPTREMIGEMK